MEQWQEMLRQISSGEPLGPGALLLVMVAFSGGLVLLGAVGGWLARLYVMLRYPRDPAAQQRALRGDE